MPTITILNLQVSSRSTTYIYIQIMGPLAYFYQQKSGETKMIPTQIYKKPSKSKKSIIEDKVFENTSLLTLKLGNYLHKLGYASWNIPASCKRLNAKHEILITKPIKTLNHRMSPPKGNTLDTLNIDKCSWFCYFKWNIGNPYWSIVTKHRLFRNLDTSCIHLVYTQMLFIFEKGSPQ